MADGLNPATSSEALLIDWRNAPLHRTLAVMLPVPQRLVIASIHDVSPRFEGEVDDLLHKLQSHVGNHIAMLVVPNHWGDAPIIAGSPFATRLRSWADSGIEMMLHGFYHRDDCRHVNRSARLRGSFMTAGEGEFLGLSRGDATARIVEGRALIEDVIGRPIDGFVAPAWLYGPGALEALADSAIPLAEDHLKVWSPVTGRQLSRGPVITWASRTRWRLASSLAAAAVLRRAPLNVLRIGVHPPDVRHSALVKSIEKTFATVLRSRRPGRYADLLN
jgi:predicted deacetylase